MTTHYPDNPLLGPLSRADFITNNIRLVRAVAIRLTPQWSAAGLEQEDVVSEGTIGLILAYDRYDDPTIEFSTFAYRYISGYIRNMCRRRAGNFRLPRAVYAAMVAILRSDLDTQPAAKIAQALGIREDIAQDALLAVDIRHTASLDFKPDYDDDDGLAPIEPGKPDDLTSAEVSEFTANLTPEQRRVVQLLDDGLTQSDVARTLGTTRQAIQGTLQRVRARYEKYEEVSA